MKKESKIDGLINECINGNGCVRKCSMVPQFVAIQQYGK